MAGTNSKVQPRTSTVHELFHSTTHTRRLFTTVTSPGSPTQDGSSTTTHHDFLALITTLCEVYRSYAGELIPMQSFNKDSELVEDGGTSCVVSRRAVSTHTPSSLDRGQRDENSEQIIVKRARKGVLEPKSSAMRSFITELRVRAHLPLRFHPNIVDLKGVAWDYEEDESKVPRPLLLEEFAPERSLTHFWEKRNLTRMPFRVKAELCLDVVHGITFLHECGVVHGDIKPDNILVFPRSGSSNDEFTAKLTDFGHSLFEFECLHALPAFTKQYCAPEADPEENAMVNLTFEDLKQTDAYSFGLVVLAIVVGGLTLRRFHDKLQVRKAKDKVAVAAMELVEKQDRENNDSDFDLDVLETIFNCTVVLSSSRRSLQRCVQVLENYLEMQKAVPTPAVARDVWEGSKELKPVESSELSIGYHTLSLCSHLLKEKIHNSLLQIAAIQDDPRSPLACWELSICYFVGFGVDCDLTKSSQWLVEAAMKGAFVAQSYFFRLQEAMMPDLDPAEALVQCAGQHIKSKSIAKTRISNWLYSAALAGCFEVLPDLESHDPQKYSLAQQKLRSSSGAQMVSSNNGSIPHFVLGDESHSVRDCEQLLEEHIPTDILRGDLSSTLDIIGKDPNAVNYRDKNGNTALMYAMGSGQFDCANVLLAFPQIDASIQNGNHQDALHHIFNFTDEEAKVLIPVMVEKGAKTTAEASMTAGRSEGLDLTPRPRSCPVLQSILLNRIQILECLLEASHMLGRKRQCRICENGSRYRKILSFAISLHRADAVEAIIRHLKSKNDSSSANLETVEVWVGKELLHVWSLAIRPPPAAAIDLPESLLRALHYGKGYKIALQRTLSLIWQSIVHFLPVGYTQLQEAVVEHNMEAIDFIMAEGTRRGRSADNWWVVSDRFDFRTSPLFQCVRIGHRTVFQKLLSKTPDVFRRLHLIPCCVKECSDCQQPFNYSTFGRLAAKIFISFRKRQHNVNVAQTLLALSAIAPHQDLYFVNALLNHSSPKLLTHKLAKFDERFTRQPSSFLAQAILAGAFQAADTIMAKFPKLLEQQSVLVPSVYKQSLDKTSISESYTSASKSILLRYDAEVIPRQYSLQNYILLVGSYQSCVYLLRNLHKSSRSRWPHRSLGKTQSDINRAEAATQHWSGISLHPNQFDILLVGLVKDDRPDRYLLWKVIASQVDRGQAKQWHYVSLALYYGNSRALEELIRLGWDPNGPMIRYLRSPSSLAEHLEQFALSEPSHYDSNTYPDLSAQKARGRKKNVQLLQEHGMRQTPWVVKPFTKWTIYVPTAAIIYLLIIPLTAAFTFKSQCFVRKESLGRLWVLSLIACLVPPFGLFLFPTMMYRPPSLPSVIIILRYVFLPALWLFTNFVLPWLVFRYCISDWFYFLVVPAGIMSAVSITVTMQY